MAATTSELQIKKRRVDNLDPIFTDFPGTTKRLIAIKLHDLCDTHGPALESLKFNNCNAADPNGGVSFSKAYCSVQPLRNKHFFGSIFVDALTMMSKFFGEGTVPESKPERLVLSKLLHYIVDTENQASLMNLEQYGETNLTIILANHLFGKLATSEKYVIDKYCCGKKLQKCPCSVDCEMTGTFGDTSIGNEEVWHGQLDIIVNRDLAVSSLEYDNSEKSESPGGKSPVDNNLKSTNLERSGKVIAQTVVFSFLQKQNHPLSEHFLFPCFGIAGTDLVVYFYDSEHDVLLESSLIPLLSPGSAKSSPKLNLTAILVSWLGVNYKYLSSGLPDSLKSENKKAGFFVQAKDKIRVYKNKLKSGDVGVSVHPVSESDDSYESHQEVWTRLDADCMMLFGEEQKTSNIRIMSMSSR